ncbi:MAG: hypothetical protein WCS01_04590 [bacterium]|jgi:hypothetical protein
MKMATIARFMQMNGAITGWRDGGFHWLRLPQGSPATLGTALGLRQAEHRGLRIVSTAVCTTPPGGTGKSAHASGGTGK